MKDLTNLEESLKFAKNGCISCLPKFMGTVGEYKWITIGNNWFFNSIMKEGSNPIDLANQYADDLRRYSCNPKESSSYLLEMWEARSGGLEALKKVFIERNGAGFSSYPPLERQVAGVIIALEKLGLSLEAIDAHLGTSLVSGSFDICITPKEFIKGAKEVIENAE